MQFIKYKFYNKNKVTYLFVSPVYFKAFTLYRLDLDTRKSNKEFWTSVLPLRRMYPSSVILSIKLK